MMPSEIFVLKDRRAGLECLKIRRCNKSLWCLELAEVSFERLACSVRQVIFTNKNPITLQKNKYFIQKTSTWFEQFDSTFWFPMIGKVVENEAQTLRVLDVLWLEFRTGSWVACLALCSSNRFYKSRL